MPGQRSAGLLLYRQTPNGPEVLLGHMGGPFWAKKDAGAWSIPKGEYADDEEPLVAARREFAEEMGAAPPPGEPFPLGEARQKSGKVVVAFAQEGDFDADAAVSNTFTMEWPPRSGKQAEFPEIDRAAWIPVHEAAAKVPSAQAELIAALVEKVGGGAE